MSRPTPEAMRFAAEWCEAYEAATEEEAEPLFEVANYLRREADKADKADLQRARRDRAAAERRAP